MAGKLIQRVRVSQQTAWFDNDHEAQQSLFGGTSGKHYQRILSYRADRKPIQMAVNFHYLLQCLSPGEVRQPPQCGPPEGLVNKVTLRVLN